MAISLAVKYRPQEFEDCCGQDTIVKILQRQIDNKAYSNALLFSGASGCGKTTCARIFANKINDGLGSPIEIDAASNNGVDNVKNIIKEANERSVDSKYKVYIIDECHSLTNQAWQAFLKCIEEPPKYTIFIFCTTDPQKIPDTIINRVQRYSFNRINTDRIIDRLTYICRNEGFTNYEQSVEYIAKISDGGMRLAITNLDKCAHNSSDLSIENVLASLGNFSYSVFFGIVDAIVDGDEGKVLSAIDEYYNQGNDLKLFVDKFMEFVIDLLKYSIFKSTKNIKIPSSMEENLKYTTNIEGADKHFSYLLDKLLSLKNMLKNDSSPVSTIEVMFLQMTRCK